MTLSIGHCLALQPRRLQEVLQTLAGWNYIAESNKSAQLMKRRPDITKMR